MQNNNNYSDLLLSGLGDRKVVRFALRNYYKGALQICPFPCEIIIL